MRAHSSRRLFHFFEAARHVWFSSPREHLCMYSLRPEIVVHCLVHLQFCRKPLLASNLLLIRPRCFFLLSSSPTHTVVARVTVGTHHKAEHVTTARACAAAVNHRRPAQLRRPRRAVSPAWRRAAPRRPPAPPRRPPRRAAAPRLRGAAPLPSSPAVIPPAA